MGGTVHIGTSGWHYKHWWGLFYPEDLPASEMLAFYARHFDSVEINNSFYQLPLAKTFESWRDAVTKDFCFAVKASRFITHMKKLKAPKTSTEKFFRRAEILEDKLGPILFQLPPRWHLNSARLAEFLKALPQSHQYAFEFRDPGWHVPEIYELLRKHNAAFCLYDLSGSETPIEITANFTYIRFHGPTEAKYSGSYTPSTLKKWARRISVWKKDLDDIYVYFNNDAGGHAVTNAQQLKELR
jgi:uncharacterized protein YecE (DUF72 family)